MRAISVSMSPSSRSSCAIWPPTQAARQALARSREMDEAMRQKPRMAVAHHLAEIGDLADLPEQPHRAGIGREADDLGIARQQLQARGGRRRRAPARDPAPAAARRGCCSSAPTELKRSLRVAPRNPGQRLEAVLLDRRDDLRFEQPLVGRRAERAVAHVPAGAAGDLADLGRRQAARAAPVELREPGEGDMVEIHVQAHADRVGRDQVIDLAGLEHADLGVARPRAQRAEHDRGAAALAAHQLGQREHVGQAERDDGAARAAAASPSCGRYRTGSRSAAG